MTSKYEPPSRDELLAMAYVDDELAPEARREFEARLANESHLLREVAELRQLGVITQSIAPIETRDIVLQKFDDAGGRAAVHIGWFVLLAVAIALFAGWVALVTMSLPPLFAILFATGIFALVVLFVTVLRRRLAALPHDPYRKVKR